MSRSLALLLTLIILPLGLAACGDDDESASTGTEAATAAETTAPAETTETETETATTGSTEGEAATVKGAENLDEKPEITIAGEAPSELVKDDLVTGKGAAAKSGDNIDVQYVGVGFESKTEFDASWNRGEPFTFDLGAGMVIPGWDQGVVGMKEGGRRLLLIPADLAYGPAGSPPAIGPNETLAFVVDLVKIN